MYLWRYVRKRTIIEILPSRISPMGFTYDVYANRWRMCSISYYFRNSSASINNVTNVNYDIDLQKMYVFVFNKMRVAIKKTDHATRVPWTPGKYDVVCSAHNDISRTSASQCRDYYVRCLPVLIE